MELIDKFPVINKGTTIKSSQSLMTRSPANLTKLQSGFLYVNPFSKNGVIKIIDINSNKDLISYGILGRGPGEFITPFPQQFSKIRNTITIMDSGKGDIREFSIRENEIHEIFRKKLELFGGDNCLNIFRISENRFVIRPYRKEEGFIEIRDTLGTLISQLQLCPIKDYCKYSRSTYLLHYVEKKEVLIIGMAEYGYLAAYSLKNDQFELIWEKELTNPFYYIEDNILKWRTELNQQGFWDIESTKDHIYTLYSGFLQPEGKERLNTAPSIVLKFNFGGEPVEKIILDEPIMKFSISEDRQDLWGISISPDFHLVQFEISKDENIN
ncbi:MAG: TolB-like 6-bladed beta-propeller domain-containing protein [Bacteroidales bacterium]|nr:TolB-like 6-bladed beta-propeller domain-containing protein [Bacteroidales bacterium]